MIDGDIERLAAWLVEQGLAGAAETDILDGFCDKAAAIGLPLCRGLVLIDTLHPIYEGRAFRWRNDGVEESSLVEYGRTDTGQAAAEWQTTTFHHLLTTGEGELRRRIGAGHPADFKIFDTLRAEGKTDYVAFVNRFVGDGTIGGMDCVYSTWISDGAEGFADRDLAGLRRLVPTLALAIKCISLGRIAKTIGEVYLGRDAGERVLSGRIRRGVTERIQAVLWFSDLRGYTAITDLAPPGEIIPLLNDYAEAVISSVHSAGGDVLKLIGDGALAIFAADDPADACRSALGAESELRRRIAALNVRRSGEGRAVTSVYLGLHIGEVFYGNVGADDRLDFTVVGPAVNEVSRIASMCRSADRSVLFSSQFEAATPSPERRTLVSVGRYALRGVGQAQELFTLDPACLEPQAPPGGRGAPCGTLDGVRASSSENIGRTGMSNTKDTEDTKLDEAAIDASIGVLGDESGEPKVARIDDEAKTTTGTQGSVEDAEAEGSAGGVEGAGEAESPDGRHADTESVERPTADPDLR